MGRRSDHTREELQELLVSLGHVLLAQTGLARFSGREVAKQAGYSVGTIYNVFGSLDHLIVAINSRSFEIWAQQLRTRLDTGGADRIGSLVAAYFDFAQENPHLWSAIYEHHLPADFALPPQDEERRAALTGIVEREIRAALPDGSTTDIALLTRSLIAVVHGHCSLAVTGSFALMGVDDPLGCALARVREILSAHGYRTNQ